MHIILFKTTQDLALDDSKVCPG